MVYSRDSSGVSALAAFRPVFSVRVPRLGPVVDIVLAGCSCGSLDLNSAVYPPRLKFVSSGTGLKFAHASVRVHVMAFKLRIAAGHPDAVLGFWGAPSPSAPSPKQPQSCRWVPAVTPRGL